MTQERFAETLDISVDFLSLIERGRNAPSFETLERMAKRLRLSVAQLFSFECEAAEVRFAAKRFYYPVRQACR